ncbi:MAG: hypothetical protein H0X33_03910 [Taibaiella sp.]|nr:hypothetical protein [Taibaiella sp.]
MENFNQQQPYTDYTVVGSGANTGASLKTFMANVFLWMFAGLGISALFAFLFATTPSLLQLLLQQRVTAEWD